MIDLYGSYFTFGGTSSEEMGGLVLANVDTERFIDSSGEISGVYVFDKKNKKNCLIDDDYSSSPLSFDIDIVTLNGSIIDSNNTRTIEKWLFNHANYRQLRINNEITSIPSTYYMNCRFLNPRKIESGDGVIGYTATFESDSGLLWEDTSIRTYNFSSTGTNIISVDVDTDATYYTYPKLTITTKTGTATGDITISNTTDDSARLTKFISIPAGSTIIIDSSKNYISGSYYNYFDLRNFPRLVDGTNSFTVQGNIASIKFEWNNRRRF